MNQLTLVRLVGLSVAMLPVSVCRLVHLMAVRLQYLVLLLNNRWRVIIVNFMGDCKLGLTGRWRIGIL